MIPIRALPARENARAASARRVGRHGQMLANRLFKGYLRVVRPVLRYSFGTCAAQKSRSEDAIKAYKAVVR